MKASGRPTRSDHSESIEFVPKRELDRAEQEIERLRRENDQLKQETDRLKRESERLRRELDASFAGQQTSGGTAFPRRTKIQPEATRPQTGPQVWPAGMPPDPGAH